MPKYRASVAVAPPAQALAPHVVKVAGTDYLGFAQRLDARGDPVEVTLLKPMSEVLTPYRDVRDALLVIDGIALALAGAITVNAHFDLDDYRYTGG